MSDSIAVSGVIATEPNHLVTNEGLKITSFRLASQQRRYDRQQGRFVDMSTNWYSVVAFRQLAENAQHSLKKGERVLVHGRLKQRDWTSGERSGVTIEIEADSLGHDLAWGRSEYRKVVRATAGAEPGEHGEHDQGFAGDEHAAEDLEHAPAPDPREAVGLPDPERELIAAAPTPF